jgi:carbamoyltransferase
MPFAPVVAAADADLVFRLPRASRYAARFMTITCDVRPEWNERIPAVIHVDGTARPQLIERPANPLYFDILAAFKARTGLPVLINTSFNVHEEPIINAPEECAQALAEDRVDYVATGNGVYGPAERHNTEGR